MKKKIISTIIVISLLGVGGVTYKNNLDKKQAQTQTIQYTPIKVTKGNIEKVISGSGSVESLQVKTIKSDVKDTVSEVLVKQNQEVKSGDTLMTLNNGTSITAPYDGIVSSLSVEAGSSVNVGQELAKVTDNKNLTTKIQVDEADLSLIKVGQAAQISVNAFKNDKFTGKVSDINPQGTYSNGVTTFDVTLTFDDIKSIKLGMSTEAKITVESKNNVVMLPIGAVKTANGSKFVLVKGDGDTPQQKKVETGISNDTYVEITSGLQEGDEVMIAKLASNGNNNKMSFNGGMGGMQGGMKGNFGGQQNRQGQNRAQGTKAN